MFFVEILFDLFGDVLICVCDVVSDMLGDIAIPSVVDSEPMFADDYSKVRIYIV